MKKTTTITTLVFTVAGLLALPAHASDNSYLTRARVVESIPIVETAYEQKEICSYKYVTERSRSNSNVQDKLIGGIIGGAAGSAVGKGSGRDVAAGAGALFGSEIAAQDGGITEGELIGGLAGGIIGNQVGKGSGKTTATAAGVLLGAIVGDNLQNGGSQATAGTRKKVRVCEYAEVPKKIITGYEVMFEFNNYRFSQIMAQEPDNYIDINVSVEALENRTSKR